MSKDAYYFSHDSNARQDEKILALRMKHNWKGYGLFWALVEKLRESTDYQIEANYNLIAFDLRESADVIKSIINDFGLFVFTEDGKHFYSESLINRMQLKDDNKLRAKINGIKGNLIRHKHFTKEQLSKMTNEQILCESEKLSGLSGGEKVATATQSQRKESKVKESKGKDIPPNPQGGDDEDIDFKKLLGYINAKSGRKSKVISKSVKAKYKARVKDGYTKDDILRAIDNAFKDEYHKETNFKYLTLEYFARAKSLDLHCVEKANNKTIKPKQTTQIRGVFDV